MTNSMGNGAVLIIKFPDLYEAAELSSKQSQKTFFRARATEFIALALAATFGEVGGSGWWEAGPYLALICFVVALAVRITGVGERAEKLWYDARAAAESIKSSSWQFAVGGDAFPIGDETAPNRFVTSLGEILSTLPKLDIPASSTGESGITREMRDLRASGIDARRNAYLEDRVLDQVTWYSTNAKDNKESATFWRRSLIAFESGAVLLGLMRIGGLFEVNWLGAFAAGAAGIAAWQQSKNYSLLSEVYSVTSHEVNLVRATLVVPLKEDEWASAVHHAESAFSREHTLWLTRKLGSKHL